MAADLDSGNDSVTSTPRSHKPTDDPHHQQPVRLMCSFGGKILPRPHDNQLCYVGGDTRIVAVSRTISYSSLHSKLSKTAGASNIAVKYQLPNEDLDALVTVASDEDVENMMEEIDRLTQTGNPTRRLRLFLFPKSGADGADGEDSRGSSISSLVDDSNNRTTNWFLSALNSGGDGGCSRGGGSGGGGGGLERQRSEASSIVSEVPDYLFGLESLDEPKVKTRPGFPESTGSDTGSPAPVNPGPLTRAMQSMPHLPAVKTKPESPVGSGMDQKESGSDLGFQGMDEGIQESIEYTGTQPPVWGNFPRPAYPGHMAPAPMPMPVYYMAGPGPIPQANAPVQHQQLTIPNPYVQQYPGQVPIGFHPMVPGSGLPYGGGSVRTAYGGSAGPMGTDPYMQARVVPSGLTQPLYYGVNNGAMVPGYPGPGSTLPMPNDT
ncbi:hypothetical protein Dimus_032817 [Dionaea muscipula]